MEVGISSEGVVDEQAMKYVLRKECEEERDGELEWDRGLLRDECCQINFHVNILLKVTVNITQINGDRKFVQVLKAHVYFYI